MVKILTMLLQRTVTMSLDSATTVKKQKLDEFLTEYVRVVNLYVDLFWEREKLPSFASTQDRNSIDTWLLVNSRKCASLHAIRLIKAVRNKNENRIRKRYNRIYAKCKSTGRNHFGILDKKYSEWIKGKRIKQKANKPVLTHQIAEMSCDLVQIQNADTSKTFDIWIRLRGIFPGRYFPYIPTKAHRLFNKYLRDGYKLSTSARLKQAKDGRFYISVFFQKEVEDPPSNRDSVLGIDVGLTKLLALSDGRMLGKEIKRLLNKLNGRKQHSKRWYRTVDEIKNYIGRSVNQINIADYDLIVMEDLKPAAMGERGHKNSKQLRKLLQHWNLTLVYRRVRTKCEVNRVQFALVNPAYTSQRCSNCGVICKESRQGERYHCHTCGYQIDADVNASRNILAKYLSRETAIPYDTKVNTKSIVGSDTEREAIAGSHTSI